MTPTPKVSKPHPHKSGFRCEIKTPAGWRHGPTASTEAEAVLVAQQVAALQAHESSQTVGACIDKSLEHHRDKGTRARSILTYRQALTRFLGPVLDAPLARVTPHRAVALYETLRKSTGEKTGRVLAVDTHRNCLVADRAFFAWCIISKKWIRSNPLDEVRTVGSRKRGRPQPTIDEARTLWQLCLREAGQGDDGALAAAIAISMGLRAGEIVSRTVRDLDNKDESGLPQRMRIQDNEGLRFQTKTRSSKRPIMIPEELKELLVARTRDKLPAALIFPSAVGRMQWGSWVNRQVHRLCKLAGIPEVCAHALRGCSATVAAAAGATPQMVAGMLGHSSTGVTLSSYIQKGTTEAVALVQGLKVLKGGK